MNLDIILFSCKFKEFTESSSSADNQMLQLLFDLVQNIDSFIEQTDPVPTSNIIDVDWSLIRYQRLLVCKHCGVRSSYFRKQIAPSLLMSI